MKLFCAAFSATAIYFLSACQSKNTPLSTAVSPAKMDGLQKLEGTWVGHDTRGFTVVKIKPDSTGTYTTFIDREKETGHPYPTDRYYFYESTIKVNYKHDSKPDVAIHTDNFRFDYHLNKDTLIEYDKMGVQGTLVRIRLDKH